LVYDEIVIPHFTAMEVKEMARAFWKGVISFGMVIIPIKMYVATETRPIIFHVIHKKCLTRPKQVWFCEHDEQFIDSKDTTRGYEYAKDQYLVIDENDFKKVPVKTNHTIDIQSFVEAKEIDSIYYHDSHYLEPEELGTKPFSLLREVLLKTNRVGIAKVTFQRREHLCALRPMDDILALHTLYYPQEIIDHSEISPAKQKLSSSELEMATALVNAMAASFHPEEYKDEYQEALKKMIEAKLKGVEVKTPEEEKVEIPDLMRALKASIEATRNRAQKKQVTAG
jgi:DNA end-binding protein Ku